MPSRHPEEIFKRTGPMIGENFNDRDKLSAVQREIVLRRNVYAKRIEFGSMTEAQAKREIGVMEAIAEDYRARLNAAAPALDLGDPAP